MCNSYHIGGLLDIRVLSGSARINEEIQLHGISRIDGRTRFETLGQTAGIRLDNGGDLCANGLTLADNLDVYTAASAARVDLINISGIQAIGRDVVVNSNSPRCEGLRLAPKTGQSFAVGGDVSFTGVPRELSNGVSPVIHVDVAAGNIVCLGSFNCIVVGSPVIVAGMDDHQDGILFTIGNFLDFGTGGANLGGSSPAAQWTVDLYFKMPFAAFSSNWYTLMRSENGQHQVSSHI